MHCEGWPGSKEGPDRNAHSCPPWETRVGLRGGNTGEQQGGDPGRMQVSHHRTRALCTASSHLSPEESDVGEALNQKIAEGPEGLFL